MPTLLTTIKCTLHQTGPRADTEGRYDLHSPIASFVLTPYLGSQGFLFAWGTVRWVPLCVSARAAGVVQDIGEAAVPHAFHRPP